MNETRKDKRLTYKDAGVDVQAGQSFVNNIRSMVEATHRPEVIGPWGAFSGFFRPRLAEYLSPVLVSSTDGVGTKLKIAFTLNRHDSVGIDLVAMCVNDLACQGAEPLFFLDYLATGKLEQEVALEIIKGITIGCREAGCALIGGETAELPGLYARGEYDLAGFAVGIVDEKNIIDGSTIVEGDQILALASNGLHSNGYSLARKVLLEKAALALDKKIKPLNDTLGSELLKPTRIYSEIITELLRKHTIKGIAHITGGGIYDNLGRLIPDGLTAEVLMTSVSAPPIFKLIQELGNIEEHEMHRTFNMGVGMVMVVSEDFCQSIICDLKETGEEVYILGKIERDKTGNRVMIRCN